MGMMEMRFDCTFRSIQLRSNLLQLKSIVIPQVKDMLLFGWGVAVPLDQ